MAEPANVPRKTFTGYLSLKKNIRHKCCQVFWKVFLSYFVGPESISFMFRQVQAPKVKVFLSCFIFMQRAYGFSFLHICVLVVGLGKFFRG